MPDHDRNIRVLRNTGAALTVLAFAAQPAGATTINLVFDSSVTSLSNAADIQNAFNTVAQDYAGSFSNNATVNVGVSWGSVRGTALPSNAVGASVSSLYGYFNYGQVRSFLTNAAASNPSNTVLASAARYLPANAPSGPAQYAIPSSEMKALGLISGSNGALDGSIGFAGNASGYDFDPRNGINAGSYDFQAVAAHELGEVLGRISGLGASTYRTPLDLFRYSAPGVLSYDYNSPAYFSIDGGQTNGGNFNYSASGGDRGDLAGGSSDIQNAFVSTGQNLNLTAGDLAMLDALGWGGANLGGSNWYAPDTVAFNLIDGAPDFNVPEPGSLALLAAGVAGLLFRRRRSA